MATVACLRGHVPLAGLNGFTAEHAETAERRKAQNGLNGTARMTSWAKTDPQGNRLNLLCIAQHNYLDEIFSAISAFSAVNDC
jgi:hypothetical protein